MGIEAHCHHRCTVELGLGAPDGYGQPATTPATVATAVPCRLVARTQRVPDGVLAEQPTVTTYTLIVPGASPIAAGHRVVAVVDRNGATIDAGPFRVGPPLPRRAASVRHTTYPLERLGGPYARGDV